ncbi:phage tail tube protein [Bacillus coahuilensis]|uniref:phage tail tube protein n=1 Tax=Bacillus coahuilensis TaxID=408580 RepID=UPI000185091B|nr:phage tail tube protein [Bacillus coahuilensis]
MSEILRYFATVFEDSFNEPNSKEPTEFVDMTSSSLDIPQDRIAYVPTSNGRGTKRYVKTSVSTSGNVVQPVDVNSIGFWLKATLMKYVFEDNIAAGSNFNRHLFYGGHDSNPLSFVSYVGKQEHEEIHTGCVVESLEIAVSDTIVTATVNIVAANGERYPIRLTEEVNLNDTLPFSMHEVNARINGTDKSRKIQEMTISISNNPSVDAGKTIGSRYTRMIVLGERTVNVSLTYIYEDDEELILFENEESFSLDIDFTSLEEGSMHINLPLCVYESLSTPVSGRDAITQSATIRALETTVDVSDGSATAGSSTTVDTDIIVSLYNKKGEIK